MLTTDIIAKVLGETTIEAARLRAERWAIAMDESTDAAKTAADMLWYGKNPPTASVVDPSVISAVRTGLVGILKLADDGSVTIAWSNPEQKKTGAATKNGEKKATVYYDYYIDGVKVAGDFAPAVRANLPEGHPVLVRNIEKTPASGEKGSKEGMWDSMRNILSAGTDTVEMLVDIGARSILFERKPRAPK